MYKTQAIAVKLFLTVTLPILMFNTYRLVVASLLSAENQRVLDQVNGPGQLMPLYHIFIYMYLPYVLIMSYLLLMIYFWKDSFKKGNL